MCNGKDPLSPATSKDVYKFQLTQLESEIKFLQQESLAITNFTFQKCFSNLISNCL